MRGPFLLLAAASALVAYYPTATNQMDPMSTALVVQSLIMAFWAGTE